MEKSYTRNKVFIYTLWSVLIGLLFPVISIIWYLITTSRPVTFNEVLLLHNEQAFIYVLDILPVVFGLCTFLISKYTLRKIRNISRQINSEKQRAEKIFGFIEKLRNGDVDAEYHLHDEDDMLGVSLINLRDELKRSREEEELRRKEDNQRHWATEGIAKFSEILREYNNDMEKMSYNVISTLVKYVGAIQGGFFIVETDNEEEKYIQQYASYAYDRKKFADKKIEWGEGLIGACAQEKETIYMGKVTEGYVHVTSGLGKSNPRSILIVPLKINEDVHGVVELASFKQFEKYKIEFIEKLAESIASTISNYKINSRTAQLLEESRDQAKKMAEQEELLRKNIEELKLTQEEAAKQSEEFISFTNSVNHTLIRAEYATDGTLLYANTKFLKKLGYKTSKEVLGKHISMFINKKDADWFNPIWEDLANGGKHFENYMKHVTKDNKDLWTMATYTCVRNQSGGVEKILFLAIDTTYEKQQSLDYEGQIQALNRATFKAEFSSVGAITGANEKLTKLMEYSQNELLTKTFFEILLSEDIDKYQAIWKAVLNKTPFDGQLKVITKNGSDRWLRGTLTAVDDMYGEVSKVLFIGNDITEQKLMEFKNKKQTEQLKIQEEKLQQSEIDLSNKLEETRAEMKRQFKKIEVVKMLNEKTLEGMLDAIIAINNNSYIEFFNQAAEELFAIGREDVIGKPLSSILPDKHNIKDDEYLGKYFVPGDRTIVGRRTEVYIVDVNEERKQVLVTLSEARMGNEYRLTAFIQNIEVELF